MRACVKVVAALMRLGKGRTNKQTNKQTDRRTNKQTHKQTQTDRQTDKQTNKQTNKQTDTNRQTDKRTNCRDRAAAHARLPRLGPMPSIASHLSRASFPLPPLPSPRSLSLPFAPLGSVPSAVCCGNQHAPAAASAAAARRGRTARPPPRSSGTASPRCSTRTCGRPHGADARER